MPFSRVPRRLGRRDDSVEVDRFGYYYLASIVTSSASTYYVIIDTGSSYTWVGAMEDNPYVPGPRSTATPQTVNTAYEDGQLHLHANTWRDCIELDGLTIDPQEIGVAREVSGFTPGIDGILGLGPTRANAGISTSDGGIIPTVVDNLYSQGSISHPVLGVYFVPTNVGGSGLLSFGSIDVTDLTSDVKYVPITQTPHISNYWGIDASFVYGNMPILGPASGILDTGAVRISLPNDAFMAYQLATGAVIDVNDINERLTITQDQYNNLQTLSIHIGDQSYDFSPNAQIYARNDPSRQIFLIIRNMGPSMEYFELGSTFFQRYYVVFNSSSSQIGFASHRYTYSTTN
ncbi:hypothetical protein ID866_5810 [Astraeus odoratus]|nr:hypothetical protein ID866_5810 [Astraeus odoratus]